MVVIDTNVLFALACTTDPTHEAAKNFILRNRDELHAPEILKVELMSLLCRKFDLAIAEKYFSELTGPVQFHENAAIDTLVEFVKTSKVRGCDSFFAYLALKLRGKVVSFDVDLIKKAGGELLLA